MLFIITTLPTVPHLGTCKAHRDGSPNRLALVHAPRKQEQGGPLDSVGWSQFNG